MELLPEDCVAHILSFTSPIDVCRVSLISSIVKSMADSDNVWEKFLPHNYQGIVSRLVDPPLSCSSKKELLARLCKPQLIDDGNKMFSIEKTTGKICYSLSARQLSITFGNNPLHWSWRQVQGSRFAEVAELRTICYLETIGSINNEMLSPKTMYGAYLKVKNVECAYGLDLLPCIRSNCKRNGICNCEHKDEWLEIELGSFYTEKVQVQEVRMCLKEVNGVDFKGRLIVDGIELRPKTYRL
ncbi:putative phloem protein [Medicago truncatula]|uniref:F-box protein n=1 Tax=Medicago truncatula TaxID=3880 RepID=G7JDE2_MEDTR|nr:F-box protein VBF [Medicago truncatula]AES87270.1 F-box protein [Medicago truncatula]RHN59217.1 putative phloem protein [Medicago truncatula]